MGSDSDLEFIKETIAVLDEFDVDYDVNVISAHRAPDRVHAYAREAESEGYQVLIAAASGAAHLAGVLASLTPLPVIGIPIPSSPLGGVDALYATVQMPSGVPVATVAVGKAGAKNAGVLAVQILAVGNPALLDAVREYKNHLAERVGEADDRVQEWLQQHRDE